MSESHSHDVSKHIKLYLTVGAALLVGTIVTVLASNVKLGILLGITVAVIIASIKGALVAGYFMHLFSERKLIYQVLALTLIFIIVMVGLIMFAAGDQQGRHGGIFGIPAQHAQPHHAAEHSEATHVP